MIKKIKKKITNRISQMSLYWKTWIVTALTILVTIGLFFIIFGMFASKFLTLMQQRKFEQKAEVIFSSITKEGINKESLEEFMLQGYTVFVSEGDKLIFPEFTSLVITNGVQFDEQVGLPEPAIDFNPSLEAPSALQYGTTSLSAFQESMTSQRAIFYSGRNYLVEVYYPVSVNQEDIKDVLFSMIPYLMLTGLAVSFIVSRFFASYVSKKIAKLNGTLEAMSSSSLVGGYQASSGDELKELENNIHNMYQNLQLTMEQLNTEVTTVKRLEADRQVFMRGATHELKTPIMAMTTMMEGMMTEVDGYENHEEYLQKCYARLQSMSRLVNEMLEVSKIEAVIYTGETDLTLATEEILELYDYMILDKELTLVIKGTPCGKIKIPNGNLKKILSNLIGNAVKYTPANGEITINGTEQLWEIRNKVTQPRDLAAIDILSPFITFDSESDNEFEKSHGLGLYIVATVLKQYDYEYQWEIDHNQSEFVFRILL